MAFGDCQPDLPPLTAQEICNGFAKCGGPGMRLNPTNMTKVIAWLEDQILAAVTDRYIVGWQSYNATTNVATMLLSDGGTVNINFSDLVADAVATVGAGLAGPPGAIGPQGLAGPPGGGGGGSIETAFFDFTFNPSQGANNWSDFGGGLGPARRTKSGNLIVLQGYITGLDSTEITTLPVGWRPEGILVFPQQEPGAFIEIQPSGQVFGYSGQPFNPSAPPTNMTCNAVFYAP